MNKLIINLLTILTISIVLIGAAPQYAKWGKVALEETQKRYKADILDYEHIGRTDLTPQKSEEKFKLWIRSKEGKEFGVFVSVQFDSVTERILSIQFSEASR